jgi:hypothetical protein
MKSRFLIIRRHLLSVVVGVLLVQSPGRAQQTAQHEDLQRLIQAYRSLYGDQSINSITRRPEGKCGLAEVNRLIEQLATVPEAEKKKLSDALFARQSQTDRIIGRFHFYYDTTGSDAPAMLDGGFNPIPGSTEQFIDSAGAIFNHVWHEEIDILGYTPPPLDSDSTYTVAIRSLAGGLYGQTIRDLNPLGSGSPPRYRSTIEIDNTFLFIYTPSRGLPALRVTAAHEFHHAIQFGGYGYWGDANLFYMEITSTWMETVVYPAVRDYYQYVNDPDPSISTQFTHPEKRFTKFDLSIQYSRAVWGKYIEKRFSRGLMRRSWEIMRTKSTLDAIDQALTENGSSFREAYLEYAFWNLNAGPRCDTSRYYTDGLDYTPVAFDSALYFPPSTTASSDVDAFGSRYLTFCLLTSPTDSSLCGIGSNHMSVIVSNVNSANAYFDLHSPFSYGVSRDALTGAQRLANNLYGKLSVPDPANWNTQTSVASVVSEPLVYPNPFRVGTSSAVWFRLPQSPTPAAGNPALLSGHLTVFSISSRQFFDGDLPIIDFQPLVPALRWNGIGSGGTLISSGVYIYSLTVDNTTYTGKFAVIRQ